MRYGLFSLYRHIYTICPITLKSIEINNGMFYNTHSVEKTFRGGV